LFSKKIFKFNKKLAYSLSSAYGLLFGLAFFGRFSSKIQVFNESYVYLLGFFIVLFISIYVYLNNKDPELFSKIVKDSNTKLALALLGFGFTAILARSAVRFFFVVAPFVALAGGYFVVRSTEFFYNKRSLRWVSFGLVIFTIFVVFSLGSISAAQASGYGSGLEGQWEDSMFWLKENTPEDAIISHWWDYGYWTQAIAERASVQDGGKPGGSYEIFILARYGMTAHDVDDALTYFKTRNVTHLLYSEEELGKYHAFSFLGSDENDDRKSTIGVFSLSQTEEVRKGFRYVYTGGWGFDKDIVLDDLVLSQDDSGIAGFLIEIDEGGNLQEAPVAVVVNKGQQFSVPLSCAYVGEDKTRMEWDVNESIPGCIVMLPKFENNNKAIENGALFYLSDKVEPGLFAQLYILDKDIEGFKEVYNDGVPLGVYRGRTVGPVIIWELDYPEYIEEDSVFLAGTSEEFRRSYAQYV